MTTADELNKKFRTKLDNQKWQLDNAAGFDRLKDAVIVGDEVKKNSCFGAAIAVLAPALIVAGLIVKAVL